VEEFSLGACYKASMRKSVLSIILGFSILATACGKSTGFQAVEIPKEQARLRDFGDGSRDFPTDEGEEPEFQDQDAPAKSSGSTLAEIAKWVVAFEARKVGAACNFFIQRVLYLMGFGRSSWTANEFDQYVKQSFESYKEESFQYDSGGTEKERLKSYIWSFPERTGFILQWKRNTPHGHIAIVQRVGETLIIYHASLNTQLPRMQKVSVDLLLHKPSSKVDYQLNVFSDFKK
jgi:hypothetical protein